MLGIQSTDLSGGVLIDSMGLVSLRQVGQRGIHGKVEVLERKRGGSYRCR